VSLRSTSHAVYEAKYHLVWYPKYRKRVLVGEVGEGVKQLFYRIAEQFDFEIDWCEVAEDIYTC
jgi:putative transposase